VTSPLVERVVVIVCDSWGVGDAPDAHRFGDAGSNTLGNLAKAVGGLRAPHLEAMGLGCLTEILGVEPLASPGTAHGRATELSTGKDTTTGHWEMMGIVVDRPFPLYPNGFPPDVIEPFTKAIGRSILGNRPASGTVIIEELGSRHLSSGDPIVYTSGDSVFQIAAHMSKVPLETLYGWCEIARSILVGPHAVGRVIARPFEGEPGSFVRRPERRDFSLRPPGPTFLDVLADAGVPVYGIGKIGDIFAGSGMTESRYTSSNDQGIDLTIELCPDGGPRFLFTNLVDFDSKYGHRNDPNGYAEAVEAFDRRLPELVDAVGEGVLMITGDHGCDPTTPSTDHSRERTPLLVAGVPGGPHDIGTRHGFGDLGATVLDLLGVERQQGSGTSFAQQMGFSR
jgi:phosphopentomutase